MNKIYLIPLLLLMASCHFFEQKQEEDVVARVGNQFLYKSDIQHIVGPGTPPTDSILLVKTFIDKWATQKLLMEKAKINLTQERLDAYDELVANYKTDLYTKGYVDIIATQSLNTQINEQELDYFYTQNQDNFRLNEELIQLRYIHVGSDNRSINNIKQQLYRFNEKDKQELQEREIQFKTISLNDSVWVQAQTVKNFIPVVTDENYDELLKKSNRLELQDSLGVYLIFINDVLLRNEIAPLSYVRPTIEQIILNRRKLDIIRNLEKDILQDALRNNNYEVYE
jgi:hypothetical protein